MAHNGGLVLRYAVGSDPGLRRSNNEDAVYASSRLLAVADGMGGHAHGEVASGTTASVLAELDANLPAELGDIDLLATLAGAVAEAARRLIDLISQDAGLTGMGTTLTALLWNGREFGVVHLGDSRGYLLRDDTLHQITRDHTMIQALVDSGRLTPEQAAEHPRRSVLVRALQADTEVEPDLFLHQVAAGDRYLLCSDGLTDVVPVEAVGEALAEIEDPDAAVRRLIELANEGGGPDNISCVLADVGEASRGKGTWFSRRR
ncbi:PP2C family protein-serine/threonine phosphatase [Amycolatopsis anabasis]|uniref:PP2C family protein-serine/threonine phosphatase n=1 Tax=Amycolatopsis anabasis TaxID=1840409 RepID=UPI00131BA8F7|nr:PP2C family serine/threonine-protein phosphatase [Amycolatopsis anabasis]